MSELDLNSGVGDKLLVRYSLNVFWKSKIWLQNPSCVLKFYAKYWKAPIGLLYLTFLVKSPTDLVH